jgi:hypothetical protein
MLQATTYPAQAYQKRNKSSDGSVEYRSALVSWTHELDLAYTTTDFDEFPSYLATTLYDPTGFQQLYSEEYAQFSSCGLEQQTIARDDVQGYSVPRHSTHHFGNQQPGVCPRYLGQHRTYENPENSLTIDPASYGAIFGESESKTISR